VGLIELEDEVWQVTFMDYDLGYFDCEICQFTSLEYPPGKRDRFQPKEVSPMPSVNTVTHVSGCTQQRRF